MTSTAIGDSATAVIGESVLAAITVRAATAVPGVVRVEPGLTGLVASVARTARQRLKGLDPAPTEGVRVTVEHDLAGASSVRLTVAVAVRGRAVEIGAAVQRAVAASVAASAGVTVSAVTVSIMDIDQTHGQRHHGQRAGRLMAAPNALVTALLEALRDVPGLRLSVPSTHTLVPVDRLAITDIGDTVVELRVVALELPLPPLLARAEKALRGALLGTAWANARLRLVVTDLDASAFAGESGVTRSGSDEPR